MSNAYGFTQTPVNSNAPNTVNASERQQRAKETEDIKEKLMQLESDVMDLKKAVDQLTIDVYRKK